jgi:hypothetical protein
MTTKAQALRDPRSCLNKAGPDEFIFVLRSNDPLAVQTIRLWAVMAEGHHEQEKIAEARQLAQMMEQQYNSQPRAAPSEAYDRMADKVSGGAVGNRRIL